MLYAVDPSINSAGVASFVRGRLRFADVVKSAARGSVLRRVTAMSRRIQALTGRGSAKDDLALEWPKVYTQGSNDRNDLFGLAGICSALAFTWRGTAHPYLPSEWVRQLKKSKSGDPRLSPRGLYISRRLDAGELEVWAKVDSHDTVDAIGIGLHHLGRMERQRKFPGSSEG